MDIIDEFQTAQELTREVLKNSETCRNDDRWLIIGVWKEQGLIHVRDGNFVIASRDVGLLAQPETITRVRRELQNDRGQFLPTDPAVLAKRRIKEELVRAYYANTQTLYDYQTIAYDIE